MCVFYLFSHFLEIKEAKYCLKFSINADYKTLPSLTCEIQWLEYLFKDFNCFSVYASVYVTGDNR